MNVKNCQICNVNISYYHCCAIYCKDCSAVRRKEKMKIYSLNRKPENQIKNKNNTNQRRKINRSLNKELGLCTDCGSNKERKDINLCTKCHALALKSSTAYNRRRGMLQAGSSFPQRIIFDLVSRLTNLDILVNTRKIIINPETNTSLELDIYIKDLNLAIEVDGPMHRIPCYGQKRLDAQIKNDSIKDAQCLINGIKLIRINTDDINIHNLENIRTILSEAVLEATVNQL